MRPDSPAADRALLRTGAEEVGGGGVAGVAVLAAICAVAVGLAPLGGVLAEKQRLHGAADAAALAAADTAAGRVGGVPCETADAIARALEATVTSCSADDAGDVTIVVTSRIAGWEVTTEARAGPPRPG
jgi:secretion/DNA translocation related TadE-like protein